MRDTLLLFDIDGTLTRPRQVITENMFSYLINDIKPYFAIGLVGGSDLNKIKEQMGPKFEMHQFDYIFPENGLIAYKNGTEISRQSIADYLGEENSQRFVNYCLEYMSKLKLPLKRGTFIEYRTGLINVSPIGRSCNGEMRNNFEKYDSEHKIRNEFISALQRDLPNIDLQYSIGGQISFDAFPKGWNKTYCLQFVDEYGGKIHFFGDKTFKGGNDYEIFVDNRVIGHSVTCPENTLDQLQKLKEQL